ncbi:hypothetical protein [Leucobacter komagatae]|uniref:hypothetical protein n=1 Tax=Leucobacter komagatae TaxID=55969 RepID=UPI0006978886|nr:hypothetical protein [Leucobacter komagatae]
MHFTKRTILRSAAFVGAAIFIGGSLTGCSALENIKNSTADAWKVTYELSVDSESPVTLTDVSYLDQASRTDERSTVSESEVLAKSAEGGHALWSTESLVIVGDTTSISATPAEGDRLTCKILLDGEREIATQTGAPGEPVSCEAVAPPFAQ